MNTTRHEARHPSEQLLINELELLLAELRTNFSVLRTGLAVLALPLTVVVFLVATAEYHALFKGVWIGSITVAVLVGISLLGLSMTIIAKQKIDRINSLVERIKAENKRLAEIVV